MVLIWLWSNMIFVLSLYKNRNRNYWKKVAWQGVLAGLAMKRLLQHIILCSLLWTQYDQCLCKSSLRCFSLFKSLSMCRMAHFWQRLESQGATNAKKQSLWPPTLKAEQVVRSEVLTAPKICHQNWGPCDTKKNMSSDLRSSRHQKTCRQIWGSRRTEQVCPTHLWGAGSADIVWKSSNYKILSRV